MVEKPKVVKPAASKVPTTKGKVENAPVPEETELSRKLRLKKLQEAADMDNAAALFGSDFMVKAEDIQETPVIVKQVDWLESLNPTTPKDFDQIVEKLGKKLKTFESSKHYIGFVEGLTKALLASKDIPEVRKVASSLTELVALKQKEKTAAASKKKAPSLGGAKKGSTSAYADYGDFDDDGDGFD